MPKSIRTALDIYLGEDGSPDGLNFLDLGGTKESLELVGLYQAKKFNQSKSVNAHVMTLLSPLQFSKDSGSSSSTHTWPAAIIPTHPYTSYSSHPLRKRLQGTEAGAKYVR